MSLLSHTLEVLMISETCMPPDVLFVWLQNNKIRNRKMKWYINWEFDYIVRKKGKRKKRAHNKQHNSFFFFGVLCGGGAGGESK